MELAGVTHKLTMFADDMLMYVSPPQTTLPNFLSLMGNFATFSGLHINLSKSLALNVSLPDFLKDSLQAQFLFQWTSSLPYLGVCLTSSFHSLYATNYPPLIYFLKHLLDIWDVPQISWMGRIHAIKMSLLPKVLYNFRVLPIPVPRHSYFTTPGLKMYLVKIPPVHTKSQGRVGSP